MRFLAVGLLMIVMVACAPVHESKADPSPAPVVRSKVVAVPVPQAKARPTPAASIPVEAARMMRYEASGITFEGVAFDARSHRLVVVDQAAGPGSSFTNAAAAAQSIKGLAAVNGGFFTPEGEPLGLVIAAGKRTGSWNSTSSLGSGVWHDVGTPAISRREKIGRSGAERMRELIQAGPMLVENGRAISGLDSVKTSARTMILWDGASRWWIGRSSPASLSDTAAVLAKEKIASWRVRHALNLDGGRSSELWISENISGGPLVRRPPWNRPVRNFLVLIPAS